MVLPLQRKSNVVDVFVKFKFLVENLFHTKIATLYSDNGGEFQALTTFQINDISHLALSLHTQEHSGYFGCHQCLIVELVSPF